MGKPPFLFKQVFLDFVFFCLFFFTSPIQNPFIYRQKILSKYDKVHNSNVLKNNNRQSLRSQGFFTPPASLNVASRCTGFSRNGNEPLQCHQNLYFQCHKSDLKEGGCKLRNNNGKNQQKHHDALHLTHKCNGGKLGRAL